jgi:geranylgeranylglycerol-phosphate geranylgeranyltransferase
LAAVANGFNDYEDQAIDSVVHAERPIPSGAIQPRAALVTVVVAGIAGIALAAAAARPLGVVSVGVVVIMLGYGRIKASSGMAANAVVAVVGSLPFLYGAWAAGAPRAAVPLMALAAPLQLAREVAKDVDDVAGDRGQRRTLPLIAGQTVARWVGVAAACVAVLVLTEVGGRWRPLARLALLPAGALVMVGCWQLARARGGAPRTFKLAMVLAILGMIPLAP